MRVVMQVGGVNRGVCGKVLVDPKLITWGNGRKNALQVSRRLR
jgi:hypothetical protein